MAAFATTILICLLSMICFTGCSSDEEGQSPLPTPKVVKPIAKPAPQGPGPPATQDKGKGGIEARLSLMMETGGVEKKKPAPAAAQEEGERLEQGGFHTVRKGESLASIAGLQETYSDPLKWPVVFRLNLDKLGDLSPGEDFPERPLPEGLRLRIVTTEEANKKVRNRTGHEWVINVLSTTHKHEIALATVALAKNGYPIYITQGQVKGKKWMRLRVGFFESKGKADALGKKIQDLMNFGDPWITKASQEELREFGGF
jgi:hypothetical protein